MSNDPSSPQNFNIGRDLSIIGDLTIGQKNVFYTLPPLPPPDPAELQAAVTQLEQIPLQQIPAVAPNLPAGSTLPLHPNNHFVGRDEQFRQLAQVARQGGQAAVFAQAGLTGAGGIGKTQLAVEFAHRYGRYFAGGVFWLNCANPDLLSTEMAKCAQNKWVDIPYANEVKTEEWVKRLKNFWGSGWPCLVILDNCEEEKIVAEVAPPSGRVCLLITSRKSNWHAYSRNIQAIPLEVLERPDSQQLLQGLAPHLTPPEADQIAGQLGDFPLALELAGHYLHALYSSGFELPIAEYLAKLEAEKVEHESLKGWDGLSSLTNHEMNVYATFSLSYEQLHAPGQTNQLAEQLIQYLAFFAPQAPIALAWCHPLLPDTPPMMWNQAIERLLALGLVERPEPGQVQMHRLLMYFVQGELEPETGRGLMLEVAEVVASKAKEILEQGLPQLFKPLLPHVLWLAKTMEQTGELRTAALLYNNLGYYYDMNGEYPLAQPAYEQALQLVTHISETSYHIIANSLNNLGLVLMEMGDYIQAKKYIEQALNIQTLAIKEKWVGANFMGVEIGLKNLGSILMEMGDYIQAKKYIEQALNIQTLAIKEKWIGANFTRLAIHFHSLGSLSLAIGDYAGAKMYTEYALTIREQVYGPHHPKVAGTLNNLGQILQELGDYASAKLYTERALAIFKLYLGKNHPNIAISLNNLGQILKDMGDYAGAKEYTERALAIDEQVYGAHHPTVARDVNNLGTILVAMGDYAGAKGYFEISLAIFRKILGESHPNVANSLNNLGAISYNMGEYAESKKYTEQALEIWVEILGKNHSKIAISLDNLGQISQALGDYAGAKSYAERALVIAEKELGVNHPQVAITLGNLGQILMAVGDYAGAKAYAERGLAIEEKELGVYHPHIATSLSNLGQILQALRDYAGAKAYAERALTIYKKALGANHPHTQIARENLAIILQKLEEQKRAS